MPLRYWTTVEDRIFDPDFLLLEFVPLEYTRKIKKPRESRKEEYYIYFGNAGRLSTSVSLVALFAAPCVKRITLTCTLYSMSQNHWVFLKTFFPWRSNPLSHLFNFQTYIFVTKLQIKSKTLCEINCMILLHVSLSVIFSLLETIYF